MTSSSSSRSSSGSGSGSDDTLPYLRNSDSHQASRANLRKKRVVRRSSVPFAEGAILADRYRLLAPVGSGGMGTVYEAIDEETNTVVAIKGLKRSFTQDNLRRFRREAESASAIRHPNLCRVHYLGVEQGSPFIVMERLHGETLRKRISRLGPFSVADTVAVGVQLLDALAKVHEARILHRDIKPGNVLITTPPGQSPFIKVIDFGLVRLLPSGRDDATLITTMGVIPGTPAYLTPEQVMGVRDLDEGVDIWATGLTLYEMLTGRYGFEADTFEGLVRRITQMPAPSARHFRSEVPAEVDRVLAKALAKRRQERWTSATLFREALITAWAHHRAAGLRRAEKMQRGSVSFNESSTDSGKRSQRARSDDAEPSRRGPPSNRRPKKY